MRILTPTMRQKFSFLHEAVTKEGIRHALCKKAVLYSQHPEKLFGLAVSSGNVCLLLSAIGTGYEKAIIALISITTGKIISTCAGSEQDIFKKQLAIFLTGSDDENPHRLGKKSASLSKGCAHWVQENSVAFYALTSMFKFSLLALCGGSRQGCAHEKLGWIAAAGSLVLFLGEQLSKKEKKGKFSAAASHTLHQYGRPISSLLSAPVIGAYFTTALEQNNYFLFGATLAFTFGTISMALAKPKKHLEEADVVAAVVETLVEKGMTEEKFIDRSLDFVSKRCPKILSETMQSLIAQGINAVQAQHTACATTP